MLSASVKAMPKQCQNKLSTVLRIPVVRCRHLKLPGTRESARPEDIQDSINPCTILSESLSLATVLMKNNIDKTRIVKRIVRIVDE
jgi:hypothetical protein